MFNPHHHQPDEADFFINPRQESDKVKFWRGMGNASEFGLWFSVGLTIALFTRLIPALIPAYVLLQLGASVYLWLSSKGTDRAIESLVIAAALTLAIVGAWWDFVWRGMGIVLAASNPLTWVGVALFIVGLLTLAINRRATP